MKQEKICPQDIGKPPTADLQSSTFPDLLFLKEKVGKRTSHQMHYFVLVKLLRFQRTFLEKSFVSRFGAEAPTYLSFGERCAKELCSKTPLHLGEVFEIPKDFLQKVLCVRVWGGQPQLITLSQKKHGIAVLFILSKCVGTAFQTLLQEAFKKAP